MAEQFIGPYRVVREIGRGGMGAVVEAVHPQIQRRVAIKVLHPQFAKNEQLVTRFFNEARAVNIVNHPSIVQISEFAQLPDGTAYIVMEYLDGESLGSRMKRSGGRLPLVDALRLSRQIAAALAAAHAKGIIHRDLKPDNIMIVADPEAPGGERAKVLDFGIAKLAAAAVPTQSGDGLEQVSQTRTGVMIGTPLYMAPEQCKGAGTIDDKADVYSLGVMLYRMLCGRPPFIGEGAGSVLAMHIYEPPPPLREFEPSIPEDLAGLVHLLLSKDPAQRPPMLQVAQALEQLKAIHASGWAPGGDLPRVSQNLPLITPLPTPIPLAGSGVSGIGSGPLALSQTGPSQHGGLGQLGLSQASLLQSAIASAQANTPGQGAVVGQAFLHPATPIATPPRRRTTAIVATTMGISILVGAALFGSRLLHRAEKEKPPAIAPAPVVQAVRMVRFAVHSEPPGAQVVRALDQRELGQTPWQSEQPAGSGPLVLILRHPGFAERIVTIDQSANAVIKEALQPLITPSAMPPPPQEPAPEGRVHSSRRNGKRGGSASQQNAPGTRVAPAQAAAGTASTPTKTSPTPPVNQSSPPSKEETSHGRIQMVD